ncbi:hypothetical protein P886_3237 [Alteromonadaceae bacterium 2753L.S.0a.02]|nr:hypothetical protein P886_3237 [Alteromonadaceae bacterium 2753L.S.0a.02]
MFTRLILALAFIAVIFYLMAKYRRLGPEARKQWLIKTAVIAVIVVLLLGVVTGRMHWLGAIVAGLLGFAKFGMRLFGGLAPFFRILGPETLGNPIFTTPYLRVQLNLQNKTLTGEILDGPYKGEPLQSLRDSQLQELEQFYRERDKRSYFLIRVLRQGANTGSTEQHSKHSNYASAGEPSYNEALQILGLETYVDQAPPDKSVVVKAHRKLMQKLHPDHGGNDYLASRVNIAKEVVLRHLRSAH